MGAATRSSGERVSVMREVVGAGWMADALRAMRRRAAADVAPFSKPLVLQVGLHSHAAGSAYVELGGTKVMAAW